MEKEKTWQQMGGKMKVWKATASERILRRKERRKKSESRRRRRKGK